MAAGGLIRTDQAHPLWREEELHGERMLSATFKPAVKDTKQEQTSFTFDCWLQFLAFIYNYWVQG